LRDDGGRGVVVDGNEMKSKDMHQKSSELSFSPAMACLGKTSNQFTTAQSLEGQLQFKALPFLESIN
jgi:hypothetical protein